jgi:hypothetical protein
MTEETVERQGISVLAEKGFVAGIVLSVYGEMPAS